MTSTNGNEAKRGADECSDDPKRGRSPIVRVKFTPPKKFEFSCHAVSMRAAGRIQLHQFKPTDAWSFVCPTRLPPEEFTYEVGGNGKTMTINDKHTVAKEYCYGITILDDQGVPHNSDDDRIVTNPPMIRNL
jgi:hypothetical protein